MTECIFFSSASYSIEELIWQTIRSEMKRAVGKQRAASLIRVKRSSVDNTFTGEIVHEGGGRNDPIIFLLLLSNSRRFSNAVNLVSFEKDDLINCK